MTHTYQLEGMTCGSCENKVRSALLQMESVESVDVSKENNSATISMAKHIPLAKLQSQLAGVGAQYRINAQQHSETVETARSWLATYKPVLLIFVYIFTVTGLIELTSADLQWGRWMRHFMAGFFLVFSFFKMLNLQGFKDSYRMYDVIARKFPAWGYIYAFTELLLGIAFLVNFNPVITNTVTLIVMSVSIVGVLQTVLNKKAIKCACLGDVFNLPMSTVTIIEDGLMIAMSAGMLVLAI
ncbi:heavy-metal-associated domain-containing protein [Flavilitoribacter nigricans]|uniref:Heavy metal transporter n=1 Tax=Flavilitoribacter nigricans (strain ATCC 23147 / DSM 23189 / NBRC 102662 / NCIMB 1420 / SS-2) TaxID=1122177 RepID=A0A2D0NGY3_FLAN2|nr:heavy metal-associated domain-containing protein [Flavilitoribacter nigricans]PHN07023.1 heavy metal transporter [Flavilitoribacter nigricans DSM 23189 = NBRC 102662]